MGYQRRVHGASTAERETGSYSCTWSRNRREPRISHGNMIRARDVHWNSGKSCLFCYGYPRYVFGRKRREAEAAPDAEADAGLYRYHYPYFNYGYYGFPRYVFGRKRRDAE